MPETILVVAEQREGKLNRVSFETIAAAQSIAKETGWPVEVVLPGNSLSAPAAELATKACAHVYALESPSLENYTADAYVHALKNFVAEKQPKLVLFPHTYQVRDFAPRLALALDRTLIYGQHGYKFEAGQLPSPGRCSRASLRRMSPLTATRRGWRRSRSELSVADQADRAPLQSKQWPRRSADPRRASSLTKSSRKPSRPSISDRPR